MHRRLHTGGTMYISEKHLKRRWDRYDNDRMAQYVFYNSAGTPTEGSCMDLREHHRFSGYDIPNFHHRVKSGELLAHTPFRAYQCLANSNGSKDVNGSYTVGNYALYDDWVLTEDDLVANAPNDGSKFVQEAAAAIYSTGWDALTFMAELTELRTLFKGALKTLSKLVLPRNWKKLSLMSTKDGKMSLIDEWLSGRYGWRCLVFDIIQINDFVSNIHVKRTKFAQRKGTKYSFSTMTDRTIGFTHYDLYLSTQTVYDVSLRGVVNAQINLPKVLINPIATAWELIPLSFVVDWFYTIGKAIEAASFEVLAQRYASSWGYQITGQRTFNTNFSPKATYLSGTHEQTGYSDCKLVVRCPCSVPYTPHLAFRLNEFKVLDLVSLALQRLRR